jgi:pSer/pThr/pTyr-binding forkhead associated (FHA) protein
MEVALVMFKADGERRDFPLSKQTTVIGRKPKCDLRIPLSSVSRQHCQLEVRDDGLYCRDLGSSNGTFYNGDRIEEASLEAGGRLTIGPVHFTVVIDGQPNPVEPVKTVVPEGSGASGAPAKAAEKKPTEEAESLPPGLGEEDGEAGGDLSEEDALAALEGLGADEDSEDTSVPKIDFDEELENK